MLLRSLRVTSLLAPRAARCLRIAPPRPAAKAWRCPLNPPPAVATRMVDLLNIAAPASAVLATNLEVAQCMDGATAAGAAALATAGAIAAAVAMSDSGSDDEAEATAPAAVRPYRLTNWAKPGGGHGRLISECDLRSRPSQVVCRDCGIFDADHILTTSLMLASFKDEADLRAHALVITNTAFSTGMLGLRIQQWIDEPNRWFSMGSKQSTELIDAASEQHHAYVHEDAEKGALVDFGQLLNSVGFLGYDADHNIVDGQRIADVKAMAEVLTSPHSHATAAATIENAMGAFFVLATGDSKLSRLAEHVGAVCFWGAVGMKVPPKFCEETLEDLEKIVFTEEARTRRADLLDAIRSGDDDRIATEKALFLGWWEGVKPAALEAYPHEEGAELLKDMHADLLRDGATQQANFKKIREENEGGYMFMLIKDPRSTFGARDAAMEHIIRLRFEPDDWDLDGLWAGNNADALMKAPVLATVLANNYATTMDINAPLLPHMATYGPGAQAASNAHALYNQGGTRLVGQTQCDMFFVLDNGTVLQSAREGDAAITGGFVGRARGLGYDEEDDVEAIKAMLIDPTNSLDGLAVRCIADPTPVREEDEVWLADGFLTGAHHHAATYKTPSDEVRAAADAHRAELVRIRDLEIENGTADEDWVGRVIILEGDRVGGSGGQRGVLLGGKPFGAAGTFGDGEQLYDSTAALGKILAGKGADVLDATLHGFDYKEELGTSTSTKAIPSGMVMIVSNGYTPSTGELNRRIRNFRNASEEDTVEPKLLRESVLVEALKRGGDLSFEGHEAHSMFKWDKERRVNEVRIGGTSSRLDPGYVLRTNGPNGETYGVPAPAVPRAPRAAPVEAVNVADANSEFSDEKVPPASKLYKAELNTLYLKRFGEAVPKSQPKLYPGTKWEWVRNEIVNDPEGRAVAS